MNVASALLWVCAGLVFLSNIGAAINWAKAINAGNQPRAWMHFVSSISSAWLLVACLALLK